MAQAQGSNARIGLLKESTWGTTPSVSAGDVKVLPFETESLNASQERIRNPHLTGGRNNSPGVLGRVEAGGDLSVRLNPLAHGWLLRGLLGAPTTTQPQGAAVWAATTAYAENDLAQPTVKNGFIYKATTAGTSGGSEPTWPTTIGLTVADGTAVWTCEAVQTFSHLFKVPASLPSYTLEKWFSDAGVGFRFPGMTVGAMRFTFGPAGFAEVSVSFLGKDGVAASQVLDAAPTTYADNPFDQAAAATALLEGGSPLATVTAFELSIDNGLDGNLYTLANQGGRGGLPAGKCDVSGRLTAFFEDLTLYNKAANSTESALALTLQHGAGTGAPGAEKCTLSIPELLYGRNVPVVGGAGGVLVELPFEGHYTDAAGASSVQITLLNAVASYA